MKQIKFFLEGESPTLNVVFGHIYKELQQNEN